MMSYYNPWRMLDEMDRRMSPRGRGETTEETATCDWTPAVDVREAADHWLLEADLPGVAAADIDITVDDGVLHLRGQRATSADDEAGYKRRERARAASTAASPCRTRSTRRPFRHVTRMAC